MHLKIFASNVAWRNQELGMWWLSSQFWLMMPGSGDKQTLLICNLKLMGNTNISSTPRTISFQQWMKQKTAAQVAENLSQCLSVLGPPALILQSDNGKTFKTRKYWIWLKQVGQDYGFGSNVTSVGLFDAEKIVEAVGLLCLFYKH